MAARSTGGTRGAVREQALQPGRARMRIASAASGRANDCLAGLAAAPLLRWCFKAGYIELRSESESTSPTPLPEQFFPTDRGAEAESRRSCPSRSAVVRLM